MKGGMRMPPNRQTFVLDDFDALRFNEGRHAHAAELLVSDTSPSNWVLLQ